jgi:hypothetical protein
MMTLLFMVEREWSLIDPRSFSVGYISVADYDLEAARILIELFRAAAWATLFSFKL